MAIRARTRRGYGRRSLPPRSARSGAARFRPTRTGTTSHFAINTGACVASPGNAPSGVGIFPGAAPGLVPGALGIRPNIAAPRDRRDSNQKGRQTMTTFNGGNSVPGGYYLSKSNWEIFPIARDGERLPGPASEHYVKVNAAIALMVMPALGGLMVVFLPFIGLYLAAKTMVAGITGAFHRSAKDLAATVTPGWAPGAAHFTGKSSDDTVAGESKAGEAALEE